MLRVMDTKNPLLEELRGKLKKVIGTRLAEAREDMGYSQPDVLEELKRYGMDRTQGSISQIENGKRLPSLEAFYVMVKFLRSSADYSMGLSENGMSPAEIEEELAAARGAGKINKLMDRLPKDGQRQVLTFAEYLLTTMKNGERTNTDDKILTEDDELARDEKGFDAICNVIRRRYGEDALIDILEETAEQHPQWKALLGRQRRPPKGRGVQGA